MTSSINNGDPHLDPVLQSGMGLAELAPHSGWSGMREHEHFVQFYESDTYLLDSLSGYIAKGLEKGEAGIVVATKEHRDGLIDKLEAHGLDVAALLESGQLISLDAKETLSKMMIDGMVDRHLFKQTIGSTIERAAAGRSRVRIFGEMVALFWAEGNYAAAIGLEELWNDLHKTQSFSLFCGYPMSGFCGEGLAEPLHNVCSTHSSVIPAESYTELTGTDERLRAIILLQQKAKLLEAEIAERKEAETALRSVKDELEVQVEDLRRLHEMSVRLAGTLEIESVLEEVLRATMDMQGTDMGLLSLCSEEREGLSLKVHSGFRPEFLKLIEWVPPGGGACGSCLEQRRRVIVEDVEIDPVFASYGEAAREAGFRACHSTPLITRNGNMLGVLSVHFPQKHRPTERQIRLMDLYARMAADIIENAQLHHRVQQELEERERLLLREQIARSEAESANRLKDEFLATVSHELRTPLTAILGWAHMLRQGRLNEGAASRALDTIERNAKVQAQLVEDILDVSRVITGKLRLKVGPVDAASVINAAIDSVQLAADSKRIRLEVTLDPSVRRVSGDAARLQQVVWNLLSNAIKFTPEGGDVCVRLERAGEFAQIRVSDTGQGIPMGFLPHIFDRFRQADGTTTRRHGGLGLGLAIVRHLVELHGGTVYAESSGEGAGTTFIIKLPLSPGVPEHSGLRSPDAINQWLKEEGDTSLKPTTMLEGVRVLLVDDDPDILNLLAVILTDSKATVQTADSVAEALEMLEWYRPDVLVSDLAMPDEDGYSLIRRIRARESEEDQKQIQAVALTAYARVEDRVQALSAGFNMFVPKPVEPNELIIAIANLVLPEP